MTLRESLEQMQDAPPPEKHKAMYTRKHDRKPKGDGLPDRMLYDAQPDVRRRQEDE